MCFVMQLISLFLIRQLCKYNSLYVYVYATYYENNNIMIMMLLTVAFIGRSSHITLTAYLFWSWASSLMYWNFKILMFVS